MPAATVGIDLTAETASFHAKMGKAREEFRKLGKDVGDAKKELQAIGLVSKAMAGFSALKGIVGGVADVLQSIADANNEAAQRTNEMIDGVLSQIGRQKTAYEDLRETIKKTNQEAALLLAGSNKDKLEGQFNLQNSIDAAKKKADEELAAARAKRLELIANAEKGKKAYSGNNPLAMLGDSMFGPSEDERLRNYQSEMKTISDQSDRAEAAIKAKLEGTIAALQRNAQLKDQKKIADEKVAIDKKAAEDRARVEKELQDKRSDLMKKASDEATKMAIETRDAELRASGEVLQADLEAIDREAAEKRKLAQALFQPGDRAMMEQSIQLMDAIDAQVKQKKAAAQKESLDAIMDETDKLMNDFMEEATKDKPEEKKSTNPGLAAAIERRFDFASGIGAQDTSKQQLAKLQEMLAKLTEGNSFMKKILDKSAKVVDL